MILEKFDRPHPELNGDAQKGLVFETSAIPLCNAGILA